MIKKGEMTLEELIKLILAVAGIAVLLLLAFNLYKMFSVKTEAEQAKIHLERIEKSLKKMNDGQTIEYLLTGPKGWYLVGYEALEISSNPGKYNSTTSCENKDCICFCDSEDYSVREFIYPFEIGSSPWSKLISITKYDEIRSALIASRSETVEVDISEYLVSFAVGSTPELIASKFDENKFKERMKYFFYQQEPYGIFKNPGYLFCQSQNICIKTDGIKIYSYENEAEQIVPWIGLNSSATRIRIKKNSKGYLITRRI